MGLVPFVAQINLVQPRERRARPRFFFIRLFLPFGPHLFVDFQQRLFGILPRGTVGKHNKRMRTHLSHMRPLLHIQRHIVEKVCRGKDVVWSEILHHPHHGTGLIINPYLLANGVLVRKCLSGKAFTKDNLIAGCKHAVAVASPQPIVEQTEKGAVHRLCLGIRKYGFIFQNDVQSFVIRHPCPFLNLRRNRHIGSIFDVYAQLCAGTSRIELFVAGARLAHPVVLTDNGQEQNDKTQRHGKAENLYGRIEFVTAQENQV